MPIPELKLIDLTKEHGECTNGSLSVGIKDSDADGNFILRLDDSGDKLVVNGQELNYQEFVNLYRKTCLPNMFFKWPKGVMRFGTIIRGETEIATLEQDLEEALSKGKDNEFDAHELVMNLWTASFQSVRQELFNVLLGNSDNKEKETAISFYLKNVDRAVKVLDERWEQIGHLWKYSNELPIIRARLKDVSENKDFSPVLRSQADLLFKKIGEFAAKRGIVLE